MPSSDVCSLLQDLIRIPSVNPDDTPGTARTGEAELADFVRNYLENLGFTVKLERIQPGRPNLIARAPSADGLGKRPRILFGPHLDTVGVEGMTINPFSGDLYDGKIHGRGASDTKGPMAAMLQALTNCRDMLSTMPYAIDFVGFMGEESSQWGSKQFAKHHAADYEFALIGEPTSLDIVHVTKGSLWATLTAEGKAAHSSQPDQGENAILHLTRSLQTLNRYLVPTLAKSSHPVLGHSTLNIGVISGGTRANVVPDCATAQIDIRTTPCLYARGGGYQAVREFIKEHELPLEISHHVENPPMDVPADHPWIQRLTKVSKNADHSAHPRTVGAPWFSDAAHLNKAGLPSICIGPGSIDQAHTKDEFIHVSDLVDGEHFFTEFIRSLGI
ncbi:M20 family metallopeptidase [Verrucomicrobiaceae bacterium N1E253]|uniref:M20 family metallopeptidase n=1 Tax=Oceaniferula marina TaxID=2748318 RepID=A0A851GCX8_9BACT|nr:M20 family metallopeptidase [Oceaniferula marina]NWK55403.1 M20 family metallopeptidase [Oceaniferula marina]